MPDGTRGIICSRGRRRAPPACSADCCRNESSFQCDYPVGAKKTCDRHLCGTHVHEVAPNLHYCPECFARFQREGGRLQTDFDFEEQP
ncbi:hypothetical protein HDG36_001703 [Paraburkholderia sp. Kb1A]|uniref:hypothetical protein n=1 Tax=unclassified Paraburkholderia TaxID=2615204 RepID=UPI0018059DC2|nr:MULTISPECIES: hypothetical protein [unclassified Paraburkholderia]MBB5450167.1 hypothetical protein [Paraburkholderia sp. Kb1A]